MTQPDNQPNQPQTDLANELRELGQQIESAVRNALASDRARQMQQDVSSGIKEIGTQIQSAIKAIQENPQVQQLVERGEQAVSQAQQSKVAQDFQESLARGVAQLNEQLAAFITRTRQAATDATPDPTPPAADAGPATGPTTRLDIEEEK